MDFVEDDFIGVGDLIEAGDECQHGQNGHGQPIIPF
jgi:hypothetical protein